MPVMELDRGHVRWKKVRLPLFAALGALVLAALGVVLFLWWRDVRIRRDVREARQAAARDTVEGLRTARDRLEELAGTHGDRADVQAAYAYVLALDALRHGPEEPALRAAREALARSDPESGGPLYAAAAALVELGEGEPGEALAALSALDEEASRIEEVRYARLKSKIAADQRLEARVELELMAVKDEPFLPAVTLLCRLRHTLGDLEGARILLENSLEEHPGRQAASVELALVLVEMGTDEALEEAETVLEDVVPDLEQAPKLATSATYARGLLLLARGSHEEASGPLCRAAEAMEDRVLAVSRCARARRLSGDVTGALRALSVLELDETTPTIGLREVVEANLELWRPRAAVPALELLAGRPDVAARELALMNGRMAEQSGNFAAAAAAYRKAGDRPVDAALAMVRIGRSRDAKRYLKTVRDGPASGCAQAYRDWIRGRFESAFDELAQTAPCTPALRGRFHLGLGRHAEAAAAFSAAPALDPRERVLLARATYRTAGAETARPILDELLGMEPGSVTLLREIALALLEMDLTDAARGAAADAVARNPGDPEALALQVKILRLTADPASAWELLQEALEKHPDHPGLLVEKAHSLLEDRDYEAAAETGQDAMVDGIHYMDAVLVTAEALESMREDSDADSLLRNAAITLYAHYEPTLSAAASAALVKARRVPADRVGLAKSRGAFSQALRRDIPSAPLYYQGALTHLADGRRDDALEWLHAAAEVDPAFEPPFKKLHKLGELTEAEREAYATTHGASI
jgi:tetratricopeptide (TPR) repeat protein